MKVLTIVGARPQFIKAAPVSRALRKHHHEVIVHTGQHYDSNMSDVFFEELHIPHPDYNLGIGSGTHGQMTGRMLEKLEEIMLQQKPDAVLVYGDTNSTLAGALAASKLLIPILHVESGLRSFNMRMPEEQNRIITDHVSTWLSCPTQTAINNLAREGITKGMVNTGDVMLDAVQYNIQLAQDKQGINSYLNGLKGDHAKPDIASICRNGYYLATVHRAENTNEPSKLDTIVDSFNHLDKPIIWPVHPRIRIRMADYQLAEQIILVEPVGYLEMLMLTKHAQMVLTDSGGLQKEALFLGTPCVTLRDETEWVETLQGGWNVLSAIKTEEILKHLHRKLGIERINVVNSFGDGNASYKIVDMLGI